MSEKLVDRSTGAAALRIAFRHSLQGRLLLIILALAAVPLIILQIITASQAVDGLRTEIKGQLSLVLDNEVRFIDQWVAERSQDMLTLANAARVRGMVADQAQGIVDQHLNLWGVYETILIANPQGKTIANTDDKVVDLKDRNYFKQVMLGKTVVSEPLISKVSGNVVVVFATPVYSDAQDIVGVAAGVVPVSTIAEILASLDLGETGEAYLVDNKGVLITPSRHIEELIAEGRVKERSELELKVETHASEQILAGETGIELYQNYRGKNVLGAYTYIPSVQWGLILEKGQEEALAPVTQLVTTAVIIGLLFVAVVTAVVLFVTRAIVKPIRAMANTANLLAGGDINQQISHTGKDEIGVLADSFRRMIAYQSAMATAAGEISQGNLTIQVEPLSERDVMGNVFKTMVDRLRDTLQRVAGSADQVNQASRELAQSATQSGSATAQIATTIQQVARGTAQQSESVNQTATAVDKFMQLISRVAAGAREQASGVNQASQITTQISTAINQVSANANQVMSDLREASDLAKSGSQTIQDTLNGMEAIRGKVSLSSSRVQEMGSRSDQIGQIVELIEDIASQTNLLALNAAIEAARAGEHGKGFAVVADEVRKLAERSASATKEISTLITGIQKAVVEAVSAMNESAAEVEKGVQRATGAGEMLHSILKAADTVTVQSSRAAEAAQTMTRLSNDLVRSMDAVAAVVSENTRATDQMTDVSSQVSSSVENIASISEENSAAVEEVSASTEEMNAQVEEVTASAQSLSEMAQEMQVIVRQFKF